MLPALKQTAKAALQQYVFSAHKTGLVRVDLPGRERVSILAYHSVCPADDPYLPYIGHNLSIAPEAFERQIAYLTRHYEIGDLSTLAARIAGGYDGNRPLLALTFDDGYRDNYRYAFPILRRHGVPATFFLTTDCIDGGTPLWAMRAAYILLNSARQTLRAQSADLELDLRTPAARRTSLRALKLALSALPRAEREQILHELMHEAGIPDDDFLRGAMLRWQEVKELRDAGMEIGAHTRSHPSLPYIPALEAEDEVKGSKSALESVLGEPVVHFCYPNPAGRPNFNKALSASLRASGFTTSVTSQTGYVNMGESLFEMRRIGIYRVHSWLPAFYCRLTDKAHVRPANRPSTAGLAMQQAQEQQ